MKRPIGLLVVFLLAFLPACRTTPDGETVVDWGSVALELELGAADARDAAMLFQDPDIQAGLEQLATVLQGAADALEAGDDPGTLLDALDVAVRLADGLVEQLPPDTQQDARAGLLVLRSILRRARTYAGGAG